MWFNFLIFFNNYNFYNNDLVFQSSRIVLKTDLWYLVIGLLKNIQIHYFMDLNIFEKKFNFFSIKNIYMPILLFLDTKYFLRIPFNFSLNIYRIKFFNIIHFYSFYFMKYSIYIYINCYCFFLFILINIIINNKNYYKNINEHHRYKVLKKAKYINSFKYDYLIQFFLFNKYYIKKRFRFKKYKHYRRIIYRLVKFLYFLRFKKKFKKRTLFLKKIKKNLKKCHN
jgi:hypothetical protein